MKDRLEQEGASLSGKEIDRAFLLGEDGRYHDVSGVSGLDSPADGRGFAWIDFDRDGDLDIAAVNANSPTFQLFRNDVKAPGAMLAVRLVGSTSNRSAIGSKVTIRSGDKAMVRELRAGEGFAAQNSSVLHFGLGSVSTVDSIDVRWPDGTTATFAGAPAGTLVTITEGKADPRTEPWIRSR